MRQYRENEAYMRKHANNFLKACVKAVFYLWSVFKAKKS